MDAHCVRRGVGVAGREGIGQRLVFAECLLGHVTQKWCRLFVAPPYCSESARVMQGFLPLSSLRCLGTSTERKTKRSLMLSICASKVV